MKWMVTTDRVKPRSWPGEFLYLLTSLCCLNVDSDLSAIGRSVFFSSLYNYYYVIEIATTRSIDFISNLRDYKYLTTTAAALQTISRISWFFNGTRHAREIAEIDKFKNNVQSVWKGIERNDLFIQKCVLVGCRNLLRRHL